VHELHVVVIVSQVPVFVCKQLRKTVKGPWVSSFFRTMDPGWQERGRGQRRGGRRGRGRGMPRPRRQVVSDDIRATLVDHVLVHGLTMREAGQRVQPNLSRFTVASIIRTFREENR